MGVDFPEGHRLSIIKGWDGTVFRNCLVDESGRLILVPIGESGYYLSVDENGYLTVRARGVNALGVQKDLLVDDSGRLIAMVKALFNSTVKDVKCDTSGNLTLNLKAQDLAEIINRPKYGAAQLLSGTASCAYQYTTLFSISGKGIVYSGRFSLTGVTETHLEDFLRLTVDGNQIVSPELQYLFALNLVHPYDDIFYITLYDNTGYNYSVSVTPLITFEASLSVEWYNRQLTTRNVDYSFAYALV